MGTFTHAVETQAGTKFNLYKRSDGSFDVHEHSFVAKCWGSCIGRGLTKKLALELIQEHDESPVKEVRRL